MREGGGRRGWSRVQKEGFRSRAGKLRFVRCLRQRSGDAFQALLQLHFNVRSDGCPGCGASVVAHTAKHFSDSGKRSVGKTPCKIARMICGPEWGKCPLCGQRRRSRARDVRCCPRCGMPWDSPLGSFAGALAQASDQSEFCLPSQCGATCGRNGPGEIKSNWSKRVFQ